MSAGGRARTATLRHLAILAAGVMLWPGAAAAVRLPPAPPDHSAGISVTVFPHATTYPLSPSFVAPGLEYQTLPQYLDGGAAGINTVLIQLIRNLSRQPVIRIGGVSTDRSWWPVPGMKQPLGVTYDLGRPWIRAARILADRTNAKYILGVNLEADKPQIARVEAAHFLSGVGAKHISSLEIGNEPELYELYPWYKLGANGQVIPWNVDTPGKPVFNRPPGYGVLSYFQDFSRFRNALPPLPLAGLSSGSQYWLSRLPGFIKAEPQTSVITFHRYGLNGCQKNAKAPNFTSIPNLMSLHGSRFLMEGVPLAVREAHAAGMTFRIDELNSAFCSGVPGVSNAFASSLWVLDTLFNMRLDGVDGVNLHTFPGASSALFDFGLVKGAWAAAVHPIYYGLLMFDRAAPAGSELLKLSGTTEGPVRDWATIAPAGKVHLLLVNDNRARPETVHVRMPLNRQALPTVTALEAPHASSTTDITLGGLSFGPTTATGWLRHVPPGQQKLPPGFPYALEPPKHHDVAGVHTIAAPKTDGVRPAPTVTRDGDVYTITVPAATADLLSWSGGVPGIKAPSVPSA